MTSGRWCWWTTLLAKCEAQSSEPADDCAAIHKALFCATRATRKQSTMLEVLPELIFARLRRAMMMSWHQSDGPPMCRVNVITAYMRTTSHGQAWPSAVKLCFSGPGALCLHPSPTRSCAWAACAELSVRQLAQTILAQRPTQAQQPPS